MAANNPFSGLDGIASSEFTLSIFVFVVLMATAYLFALRTVVRATRLPLFRCAHASRTSVAVFLILLSLLAPPCMGLTYYWVNCMFPAQQLSIYRLESKESEMNKTLVSSLEPASRDVWSDFQSKIEVEEKQREKELVAEIEKLQNNLREKESDFSSEEKTDWINAMSFLGDVHSERHNILVLPREIVFSEKQDEFPFTAISLISRYVISFFAFGLPGMVLGIGYVKIVRKQSEQSGLVAALLASLTWPVLLLVGGAIAIVSFFGFAVFLAIILVLLIAAFFIRAILTKDRISKTI